MTLHNDEVCGCADQEAVDCAVRSFGDQRSPHEADLLMQLKPRNTPREASFRGCPRIFVRAIK